MPYGRIAQLVRAHGLHPWCRGFESLCAHHLKKLFVKIQKAKYSRGSSVVEHAPEERGVDSSILSPGTTT